MCVFGILLHLLVSRGCAGQCSCEGPTARTSRTSFPRWSLPCIPASQKPQEVSQLFFYFVQFIDNSTKTNQMSKPRRVCGVVLPDLGCIVDRHNRQVVYKVHVFPADWSDAPESRLFSMKIELHMKFRHHHGIIVDLLECLVENRCETVNLCPNEEPVSRPAALLLNLCRSFSVNGSVALLQQCCRLEYLQ